MATEPALPVNLSAPPAEPKFFLRSKTILSALLLALPAILGAFGIHFTDDDAQLWLTRLTTVLGLAGVVFGRVRAVQPISFGTGVAPALLVGIIAIALFGGCASLTSLQSAYATPAARAATGRALLADAEAILGKVALSALTNVAVNAISGGDADMLHAAAQNLNASISAADVRKIVEDATGGALPALADTAARVVSEQLAHGTGQQTALQAVASAISGTALTH